MIMNDLTIFTSILILVNQNHRTTALVSKHHLNILLIT